MGADFEVATCVGMTPRRSRGFDVDTGIEEILEQAKAVGMPPGKSKDSETSIMALGFFCDECEGCDEDSIDAQQSSLALLDRKNKNGQSYTKGHLNQDKKKFTSQSNDCNLLYERWGS